MRAEPRLAVAKDPGALGAQPVARGDDVVDLVANMVHAARGITFEKPAHRRGLTERLEQLDLGVRQLDKNHGHAVCRQRVRFRDLRAEHLPIEPARRREIGHDDCHVVEPSDHYISPQIEVFSLREAGVKAWNADSRQRQEAQSSISNPIRSAAIWG